MNQPVVIVIGGPTASGKTKAAIEVAKALNTQIINSDSRQVYSELNIGVAKPDAQELAAAPHQLVSSVSIHQNFTTGDFERTALQLIAEITAQQPYVVLSGGTGLYLNALIHGMDTLPPIATELRNKVNALQTQLGNGGLADYLLSLDANAAEFVALDNPARVKRAIELVLTSQQPLSQLYKGQKTKRPFKVLGYYLNPSRDWLYNRINARVDAMIAAGLESEARNLYPYKHLNALQTVGYTEFFDYFDGKISLETCIEKIKQHSRNYAKRQLTWFKNQTEFKPVESANLLSTIFADLKQHGYSIYE